MKITKRPDQNTGNHGYLELKSYGDIKSAMKKQQGNLNKIQKEIEDFGETKARDFCTMSKWILFYK